MRHEQGLKVCEIIPDPPYEPGVWIDGDLCDDVEERGDLARSYGDRFFASLSDFTAGRVLSLDDVWPAKQAGA
jgi:hypothetical protein